MNKASESGFAVIPMIMVFAALLIAGGIAGAGLYVTKQNSQDAERLNTEKTNSSEQIAPTPNVYATQGGEYNGEVIQVGGPGSDITDLKAYGGTEEFGTFYLNPPEDWVRYHFTRGGAMWVNCRDGYAVTACQINDSLADIIDVGTGCLAGPSDEMLKMKVLIKCEAVSENVPLP